MIFFRKQTATKCTWLCPWLVSFQNQSSTLRIQLHFSSKYTVQLYTPPLVPPSTRRYLPYPFLNRCSLKKRVIFFICFSWPEVKKVSPSKKTLLIETTQAKNALAFTLVSARVKTCTCTIMHLINCSYFVHVL